MIREDGTRSVSADSGSWVPVVGVKYAVKKWVRGVGTPEGDPDGVVKDETTSAERPLQQPIDQQAKEPTIESKYGEKQELDLEQIVVGDYIHIQTRKLSVYVLEVTGKGPDYINARLAYSSGSLQPYQAESVIIDQFPIKKGFSVVLRPVVTLSDVFHLGLDNKLNLDLLGVNEITETAVQIALDDLMSDHPYFDQITQALDTLIKHGRQINDPNRGILANTGKERSKLRQLLIDFNQSNQEGELNEAKLATLLQSANLTKAFKLDEKVAESMKNMLDSTLEKRKQKAFGGRVANLVSEVRKIIS